MPDWQQQRSMIEINWFQLVFWQQDLDFVFEQYNANTKQLICCSGALAQTVHDLNTSGSDKSTIRGLWLIDLGWWISTWLKWRCLFQLGRGGKTECLAWTTDRPVIDTRHQTKLIDRHLPTVRNKACSLFIRVLAIWN